MEAWLQYPLGKAASIFPQPNGQLGIRGSSSLPPVTAVTVSSLGTRTTVLVVLEFRFEQKPLARTNGGAAQISLNALGLTDFSTMALARACPSGRLHEALTPLRGLPPLESGVAGSGSATPGAPPRSIRVDGTCDHHARAHSVVALPWSQEFSGLEHVRPTTDWRRRPTTRAQGGDA